MNSKRNKMKIPFSKRSKYSLAFFVAMLGLVLLNVMLNVIPNRLSNNMLDTVFTLISQIVCMGLIPFVIAVCLTKNKNENFLTSSKRLLVEFGYSKNLKVAQWLLLIPMGICFYIFTKLLSMITVLILQVIGYNFSIQSPTVYQGAGDLIKWLVLTAFLPAVFEEFSHRGLALNAMKDRGNEITQVVLSALLFALMHTNVLQTFYAFVGGCVFGYLAIRTKSIYPSMVLHFINNALATLEDYGTQKPESILGFFDKISEFWSTNNITLLIRFAVLLANLILFLFLFKAFIYTCEPRKTVKGIDLFDGASKRRNYRSADCNRFGNMVSADQSAIDVSNQNLLTKIWKTKIDLDAFRPDGKPLLIDNCILFATVTMCGLITVFTYVWGVLR